MLLVRLVYVLSVYRAQEREQLRQDELLGKGKDRGTVLLVRPSMRACHWIERVRPSEGVTSVQICIKGVSKLKLMKHYLRVRVSLTMGPRLGATVVSMPVRFAV